MHVENKNCRFDATAGFDEIDEEEREIRARRIQTYSPASLKLGTRLDTIFVLHTRFTEGLHTNDRIFQLAREVNMPHGARVVGPPGAGKTALMRYYAGSTPQSTLFTPGLGCVGIRASSRPTAGQLVAALLRAYKYPFSSSSEKTVYQRKMHVWDLVLAKGTRLIYVDEAHNLLRQVLRRKDICGQPEATVFLSELMDETHVGLVLLGSSELDQLESVDPYLADRVSVRVELPHFSSTPEWTGLLRGFSSACSWFNLAVIEDDACAKKMHQATDGNLRQLKRLLTEAVLIAAEAKRQAVAIADLRLAFALVYGKTSQRTNPFG